MTDNEIIKALELCSTLPQGCSECPYFGREDCVADSAKDAIDLIQRQQERMDRIVEQLEEEKNHCCVGCYEDYDPYEDGRFETYEEVIALLKGVQNE